MPFIPHTDGEIQSMLAAIGVQSIEELYDEIPAHLRVQQLDDIPSAANEMQLRRELSAMAAKDDGALCFIGAGAYEHHIPSAVWQVTTRGEFYSAYTPYQAEASQGTLQLIYEYQSMMAGLMALDVSNASLYDGASAMAEAVLMAVRANRKSKSKRILVAGNSNPVYRACSEAIVKNQGIELVNIAFDEQASTMQKSALQAHEGEDIAALLIQQPNFFGGIESVDELTDWAHQQGALVIAVVNPLLMTVLKPPGEWGTNGADIACGDGQPLGAPLSSGGPYYGFMCCKQQWVRQMPGRIVGRTVDVDGRDGFVLTLQAREQHIRRSKATSNICTNQGLIVTASTIHMAIMGPQGLRRAAASSHANTVALMQKLLEVKGVEQVFGSAYFHECVLQLDQPVAKVLDGLAQRGILGGYDLSKDYPALGNALLVCATETKTEEDLARYASALQEVMHG